MKKTDTGKIVFILLNILVIAAVMYWDFMYYEHGRTWRKGTASSMFVLLGAVNLIYAVINRAENLKYPSVMTVGFLLGMLGDIVINYTFIPGAALFALGHVFYFAALCCLLPFGRIDVVTAGILTVISECVLLLCPVFNFGDDVIKIICCVYGMIISLMFGKAVGNLIRVRNLQNVLIVIGCFLFFFSDLMLVFDWFSDMDEYSRELCLFTYYPAQCVLGFAMIFTAMKSRVKKA
ncbi:MAG: lysoplasmalogenase [Clostridia bacterium]|nr:lysoplasmalogenase [Clostridia bacterium]